MLSFDSKQVQYENNIQYLKMLNHQFFVTIQFCINVIVRLDNPITVSYIHLLNHKEINSNKPISSVPLTKAGSKFKLENTSGVKLFATLINRGVPNAGSEQNIQKGLTLNTVYAIRDDENPKKWYPLKGRPAIQGGDVRFTAQVSNTSNRDLENIALTIPVAAGMEIHSADAHTSNASSYDYF